MSRARERDGIAKATWRRMYGHIPKGWRLFRYDRNPFNTHIDNLILLPPNLFIAIYKAEKKPPLEKLMDLYESSFFLWQRLNRELPHASAERKEEIKRDLKQFHLSTKKKRVYQPPRAMKSPDGRIWRRVAKTAKPLTVQIPHAPEQEVPLKPDESDILVARQEIKRIEDNRAVRSPRGRTPKERIKNAWAKALA